MSQLNISTHLRNILGTDDSMLKFLLENDNYISYHKYKKNGKKRWINAPSDELKVVQKNILYNILYKIGAHKSVHGFIKNLSPKTAALTHIDKLYEQKILAALDIQDFFPSIKMDKVIKSFYYILNYLNNKKGEKFKIINDAPMLANLCTYMKRLPQGAITSPALSNIIMYNIDVEAHKLSTDMKYKYSRYADDLTFTTTDLSSDPKLLLDKVEALLLFHKFEINKDKTRIIRPHKRQQVCGVVINDVPSVSKKYYKNTRAAVYNFYTGKVKLNYKSQQKLRGRIEWINSISTTKGKKLITQFEQALGKK